ncbi:MAG: hypothetical protein EXS59_02085 [Candidatus Taylorbacteria bacterium]|nr:hypothetical protein [Candidatus Taylorbacteria bacterium]
MNKWIVTLAMVKQETLERYERVIEVEASYEDAAFVTAFTAVRLDPDMKKDFMHIKDVRKKSPSP